MGRNVTRHRAVLLSGGMDSSAVTYWLRPGSAVFVNYGQVAEHEERSAAERIAALTGAALTVINADCREMGSGIMAGSSPLSEAPSEEWWPFRNQLLATIGAGWAVSNGITELIFGSVKTDNKHADGRADFYKALNSLLAIQEGAVRVSVPAIGVTTEELITMSGIPRNWLGWTHSCFSGGMACGSCGGCTKRAEVFRHLELELTR